MNNYKVVFWDIDGVIVLSEPLHVEKITETAKRYGIAVTQEDWSGWYGIGDHRIYQALVEKGLPIEEDEFLAECLEYYTRNKDRLSVRVGFKQAFNLFAKSGFAQATVSSGIQAQVDANLEAADITLKTAFNLSATHIIDKGLNTKPAPDPYLEALRMLNEQNGTNIMPEQCIVVEDSGSGVTSGHKAGMHTIHWRLEKDDKISDVASASAYDAIGLMNTAQRFL